MRFLLLFLVITYPALAVESRMAELLALKQSVVRAEQATSAVNQKLDDLMVEQSALYKIIANSQYTATRHRHAILRHTYSPEKYGYLTPKINMHERYMMKRHQDNQAVISQIYLNDQVTTYRAIEAKQTAITDYLRQRTELSQSIQKNLKSLKNIQTSRVSPTTIDGAIQNLKTQAQTLDDFLKNLLDFADDPVADTLTPLAFTLPLSGIIQQNNDMLTIISSPQSLVSSPERGVVMFADNFEKLGKIIIINHGQGYLSIMRGMDDIYVQSGFTVAAHEPLGTLGGDKMDKDLNGAMLMYELRYNNKLMNPLSKMTGL
jgi:murein DD-endopeptidase MepM/ murein hydrolase activator NlpD